MERRWRKCKKQLLWELHCVASVWVVRYVTGQKAGSQDTHWVRITVSVCHGLNFPPRWKDKIKSGSVSKWMEMINGTYNNQGFPFANTSAGWESVGTSSILNPQCWNYLIKNTLGGGPGAEFIPIFNPNVDLSIWLGCPESPVCADVNMAALNEARRYN